MKKKLSHDKVTESRSKSMKSNKKAPSGSGLSGKQAESESYQGKGPKKFKAS